MEKMWKDTHESGYIVYFRGWSWNGQENLFFYTLYCLTLSMNYFYNFNKEQNVL